MTKARMEAFSDGVIAIIITIMVLELRAPHEPDWHAVAELRWELLSYAFSFFFLGIYWNNHHHLLQAVRHVNGRVLWANLHLLFWLSLTPFVTAWMGHTVFARIPVAAYGGVLFFAGFAYFLLTRALISLHGKESAIAGAVGRDAKGKASVGIYAIAIPIAFAVPWVACVLYLVVAVIWLIPDRRIENMLTNAR